MFSLLKMSIFVAVPWVPCQDCSSNCVVIIECEVHSHKCLTQIIWLLYSWEPGLNAILKMCFKEIAFSTSSFYMFAMCFVDTIFSFPTFVIVVHSCNCRGKFRKNKFRVCYSWSAITIQWDPVLPVPASVHKNLLSVCSDFSSICNKKDHLNLFIFIYLFDTVSWLQCAVVCLGLRCQTKLAGYYLFIYLFWLFGCLLYSDCFCLFGCLLHVELTVV